MRPLRWWLAVAFVGLAGLILLEPRTVLGQQILQNGFEARGPYWKAGSTDAAVQVLRHALTDESAHGGQRCEHLRLQVEKGSFIHYTFDLPRAVISDELNLSLWVKSNRPGIQLLCRVVLPRERDPDDASRPLTVLVRCEPYQSTRWKLLTLPQPVKRLREQGQLLTHRLGRAVDTTAAYIDQLVLNLYDGPGTVDVWVDDLEVGPVEDTRPVLPEPTPRPAAVATARPAARRTGEVQLRGNQLLVNGKRFLLRGIRHTGSPPLRTLRDAGFNTLWMDESTPPALVEDAAGLGFWLVPSIAPPQVYVSTRGGAAGQPTSTEEFTRKVSRFAEQDAVLAWDLGSNLGAERYADVTRLARSFRLADPHRPVMADVWDGYRGYSRAVDGMMMGTHRWPLMTSLELPAYRQWLVLRRQLAADGYAWTWIQTHLPEWFLEMNRETERTDFVEPIGPQPEQIRLLAYTALSAGYRGLAYWSDRYLADSHQGKDRLLAMALLNQELGMLERVLTLASRPPDWIDTSMHDVKAAVFRTPEGVLVLPMWVGGGAQFVPGQSAAATLSVTVPGVPVTATAWEVSPGRMQAYPIHRDLGGTTVQIRNFSMTSAVLFTSNLGSSGPIVALQEQQRRLGRLAAQWLHDQAQEELAKVEKVHQTLDRVGHPIPDGNQLLERSREALAKAMRHRRNGEHGPAYNEAEVALRAVRLYMRAHWERAIRDLDSPVATPYAVSFYSLPRHWQMLDQMKTLRPAQNVLPGGDFEAVASQPGAGWLVQEVPSLDDVQVTVRRVVDRPHSGSQCLMMRVTPKDPQRVPAALERTYVALHSPSVKLPPGTLVRVSAWVNIPQPLTASSDGALLFDSAGGEPLAIRFIEPTLKWRKYSLYRRVPASGKLNVTLALSGVGTVYFDDVRVEPLVAGAAPNVASIAPPAAARSAAPGR
ncbi:MAG: hypothetical protein U0736_04775 [Gemmataceae bacterium]